MELLEKHSLMNACPLHHYRMGNGLEVFLLHNPISPVAAYLTHYTVGSASETDRERGLAHFFEHMMFRETESLGDGDFDRIIAESGGVGLNAFTSYDTTAYYVSVPSSQLGRVIGLEADRMANLRLSTDLIDKERGAVLGELHMVKDLPSDQLWESMMKAAFASHPYRHPIIGYEEGLRGFSGADFESFYRTHYAPNRAVVVVAGGFDESGLCDLLQKSYGHLERGGERPAPAPEDPPWSKDIRVETGHPKVSTENLMLGWRTPGLTHPDMPALLMLSAVLSAGHSAPLHTRIVNTGLGTQAAAYSLEAEMNLVSPGMFMCDVVMRHGVPAARAENVLLEILEQTAAGVAGEDMERALSQFRLGTFEAMRTNYSLARQVGGYAVATGDPLFGQKLLASIARVGPEDLRRVLLKYMLDAPRMTVIQHPLQAVTA
ncbi:MAG: insulinase family protein [Deltaproteobacteria bacterium]|nr:insulinase family protein [Deltaproteobacteria bacterium]